MSSLASLWRWNLDTAGHEGLLGSRPDYIELIECLLGSWTERRRRLPAAIAGLLEQLPTLLIR